MIADALRATGLMFTSVAPRRRRLLDGDRDEPPTDSVPAAMSIDKDRLRSSAPRPAAQAGAEATDVSDPAPPLRRDVGDHLPTTDVAHHLDAYLLEGELVGDGGVAGHGRLVRRAQRC